MPAPSSKYSIDHYLYQHIFNPLARKLCFIHPNLVTLSNLLLIIPVGYNLLNNGSIYQFMSLILVRQIFDNLDGSIARECNKGTNFGKFFDIVVDTAMAVTVCAILFYKTKKITKVTSIILFMNIIVTFQLLTLLYKTCKNKNFYESSIVNFFHDNVLFAGFIYYSITKIYLNNYT